MNIIQVDPENHSQVKAFIDLPSRIYRGIPQWVPTLVGDDQFRFNAGKFPFYKHSEAGFFMVLRDGMPIGRLAVLNNRRYNEHNHERTAFFYLFECLPDRKAASALFSCATDWAQKRGLNRMIGPRGFTALDGLGLLIKGFELRPALGIPYNPNYYPGLIEANGFRVLNDIVSGSFPANFQFPERIDALSRRIQERRGIHIAKFHTRNELKHGLRYLKELYNGALEGTSGGIPISDDEVETMAKQLLWYADPKLIKIVLKGEKPVGFLLAYPDISTAIQRTKGRLFPLGWMKILVEIWRTDTININGAGMLEEYRGLGGNAILYSEMFKSVTENKRYRHAEVVQIGLENTRMLRELKNFGVDFNKMHRVYQQDL